MGTFYQCHNYYHDDGRDWEFLVDSLTTAELYDEVKAALYEGDPIPLYVTVSLSEYGYIL